MKCFIRICVLVLLGLPAFAQSQKPYPGVDLPNNWTAPNTFIAIIGNPVTVSGLPSAVSTGYGMQWVSDSTPITSQGQSCVGGGTTKAIAFSNGTSWGCYSTGAQTFNNYTVTTLPTNAPTGTFAIVRDGNGISCTTGGGTTATICQWNGSAWAVAFPNNVMSALADIIVGGASGVPSRLGAPTTPVGVPQQPTEIPPGGGVPAPLVYTLPGLQTRQVTGSTATDTITQTDCNPAEIFYQGSAAVAVTLPPATTLGVAQCTFVAVNNTSGSSTKVTITPTTWTIVPNNGSGALEILQGSSCKIVPDNTAPNQWDAECHDLPPVAGSQISIARGRYGPTINSTAAASSTTTATQVCELPVGDQSSALVLQSAQLGPQIFMCFIPIASTVLEIDVGADAGTPNVIVGKNHGGSLSNLLSGALATAASGGVACSRASAGTCVDGVTTASATLQNTSLSAGDYIYLVSGTADGVAKFMGIHVLITPSNGTAYRACNLIIGDASNSSVIVDAQLGPQKYQCFIPAASTIQEIDVGADGGTPNIVVGVNHQGSVSNVLSSALATGAAGATACSKTAAVACLGGATASATLQNTAMSAGDYIQLVSGTAGGVAKLMTVHIIYTLN